MKKVFTLICAVGLLASAASAAPIACAGVGNVLTLAEGCFAGDLVFSNFSITTTGIATQIGIGSVSVSSGSVDLLFQLLNTPSQPPAGADILLFYQVSGPLIGIDLMNGGTNVTIQEVACATPFSGTACTSGALAQLVVPSQGMGQAFFSATGPVYIKKDIQIGELGFISDFTNSHHIPEPLTFLMMGSGLLGLGLLRQRRKS